jgi:hypothetical protein
MTALQSMRSHLASRDLQTKKPIVGGFNFAFDLDFVLDLGFALDLAFDFDLDEFTFPSHDSQ